MPAIPFVELLLLLVGGSVLLRFSTRAFFAVFIIGATLWLMGFMFPYVAESLGMPQRSVYELGTDLLGMSPTKTPTPSATDTPRLALTPRPTRTPAP